MATYDRRIAVGSILVALLVVVAGCGAGGIADGGGDGGDGAAPSDDSFDAGGDTMGGDGGSGGVGGGDGGAAMATQTVAASGAAASGDQSESMGMAVGGAQDAASFRTNVENGFVPQPTDLTYEGIFHEYYFNTTPDEPCRQLFCPTYDRAVASDPLSNGTERYMTVGLNSNLSVSDFERPDLNLVVVLDTSGSMDDAFSQYYYDDGERRETEQRPKIEAAKESVSALTSHLREGDRFGLVTYDDTARTLVGMDEVSDHDMEAVRGRIGSVGAGGGTNLESGMQRAREMVSEYTGNGSDRETRVIYVTDAMPNEGEVSADELQGRLLADADAGIHTTFVGVGVDFNSRLVESITEVEGANYYSVQSAAQFRERMDHTFEYMVTPLVYDLTLAMNSGGYEIEQVYGVPGSNVSSGQLLHVDTLFPSRTENGSTKGGVFLLQLERTGEGGPVELEASYRTRAGERHTVTREVTFEDRSPDYFENDAIRKAVVLSQYGDLLRNWMIHERARAAGDSVEPPEEGIDPPERGELGRWEQQSVELRVSGPYEERLREFREHLRSEIDAIGDDALRQEVRMLDRILEHAGSGEGDSGGG